MGTDNNDQPLSEQPDESQTLSPELEKYSQGHVSILRLPGLRWISAAYESEFHTVARRTLESYTQLTSIPEETKDRIRPRVVHSIAQIQAYQAWRPILNDKIPESGFALVLILASGILSAILSASTWTQTTMGALGWIVVSLIAIISFVVYWVVILFLLDPIATKIASSDWRYWWLCFVFVIISLLIANRLISVDFQLLPYTVQGGLAIGFASGTGTFAAWAVVYVCCKLILAPIEIIKVRRHPEEEIIETLCYTLAFVEGGSESWPQITFKKELADNLEWIGRRIVYDLYRLFSTKDNATDEWLQECTGEMAASVRQMKQMVLFSRSDTDRERVCQSLADMLVNAANGNWGEFDRVKPLLIRSRRSRLLRAFKTVLAISFPLLVIIGVGFYPYPLNDAVKSSIITAAIGWGTITIVTWLDPRGEERLSAGISLTDRFTNK